MSCITFEVSFRDRDEALRSLSAIKPAHTRQGLKVRRGKSRYASPPATGNQDTCFQMSLLKDPDCDSYARNERHDVESLYSLGNPFFLGVLCIAR